MPRDAPLAKSSSAENALITFCFVVALALLIWVIAGPLDWFSGWRINKAAATLLFIVGIPAALIGLLLVTFLLFAGISGMLELAGVKIGLPAPPAPPSSAPGAVPAPVPHPPLEPGTETHGLTVEEATRARDVGVYYVYAVGTDMFGWPESFLEIVAVCLNDADIDRAWQIPLKPGWDGLEKTGLRSLLTLMKDGTVSAAQAREFLRRIDAGEPWQELEPPLSPEESAAAAGINVWYVWYEDNFGTGGQRDSFAVAVCLTKEEAEAAAAARGRPLQPGYDGYKVEGPYGLERESRPTVVREVLALAASGRRGAVSIDSSSW